MASPAQGAVSGSFQTMRSTPGPVTHKESMFPLTPASYVCRVLASLPKSEFDRLTPHLTNALLSREYTAAPGGDTNTFTGAGYRSGVGIIAVGLATVVEYSSSLREVPPV